MQKAWKVILVISIIINLVLGFIWLSENKPDSSVYVVKIAKLESELDSLKLVRDSIKVRIDTIMIQISNNEKVYEQILDSITNNSVSDDYLFFTEYLERNKARFDSINNPKPIKGN